MSGVCWGDVGAMGKVSGLSGSPNSLLRTRSHCPGVWRWPIAHMGWGSL